MDKYPEWLGKVKEVEISQERLVEKLKECGCSQGAIAEAVAVKSWQQPNGKYRIPAGEIIAYWDTKDGSGEVKYCPQCHDIRATTCCACGCGECTVCGYRWSCGNGWTYDDLDKPIASQNWPEGEEIVIPSIFCPYCEKPSTGYRCTECGYEVNLVDMFDVPVKMQPKSSTKVRCYPIDVGPHLCPDCGVEEGQRHKEDCAADVYGMPFVHYPPICLRCGKMNPEVFVVSDEEWEKYIQPNIREHFVCKECYDFIKEKTDRNAK